MRKGLGIVAAILLTATVLLVALWQTVPKWLPWVAGHWLPAGSQLVLSSSPHWSQGTLWLPSTTLKVQGCTLLDVKGAAFSRFGKGWKGVADAFTVDTRCLSLLPASESSTPLSLAEWQQKLPLLSIDIKRLTITPWQSYAGHLSLTSHSTGQHINYQGSALSLDAQLDSHQQLSLNAFSIQLPGLPSPLTLAGKITLPATLDELPRQAEVQGRLENNWLDHALLLGLEWQQQSGVLTLREEGDNEPLAALPWEVAGREVRIIAGQWRWPYAAQPLKGGISLTLNDWSDNYDASGITARLNVVTEGHNGKGNAVLTMGPGRIGLLDSDLNVQLTGQTNLQQLSMTASLPGTIKGSILNPTLSVRSGALLRAWGNLSSRLTLQEARLPLAGVSVRAAGVSGPLQAIVRASDQYWGAYALHLDGKAQDFKPDSGTWNYKFWGKGQLSPLQARWDMGGRGSWVDSLLVIDSLSTGFDRLHYGLMRVNAPRLTLEKPLRWQRHTTPRRGGKPPASDIPSLTADFKLVAQRIELENGGYVPPAELLLQLRGNRLDDFQLAGALQAAPIGPITLRGRWDGERLRGEGWWPKQSLTAFQSLLSPKLGITLRQGDFYAQAAFSAAREQGFVAGGQWVVKDGGLWLKDGEAQGVDFAMSYRLENHQWQLGVKQPVMLRIQSLSNLFEMQNITANLQGSYPYTEHSPLTLDNVGVDMLGGHVSLSSLRLPQHDAAVLRLNRIELSELFTALKPKQFAMSGRVSGELPLFLNDPQWLVKEGWVENEGSLTLRLDQDMANALASGNVSNRLVVNLLRYMEITRSYARVNLDNLGVLTMATEIQGVSSQENQRRAIVLNYRHEENIFHLWQSLRFGDNLQEWLEKALSQPARKEQ